MASPMRYSDILSVGERYARAFYSEKVVVRQDGTWLVRGFSKATGKATIRIDGLGDAWELA